MSGTQLAAYWGASCHNNEKCLFCCRCPFCIDARRRRRRANCAISSNRCRETLRPLSFPTNEKTRPHVLRSALCQSPRTNCCGTEIFRPAGHHRSDAAGKPAGIYRKYPQPFSQAGTRRPIPNQVSTTMLLPWAARRAPPTYRGGSPTVRLCPLMQRA